MKNVGQRTSDGLSSLDAECNGAGTPMMQATYDYDKATYYRARYYNPTTGRFLSEDPAGFLGGINKYAYVGDDPTDIRGPTRTVLIGVQSEVRNAYTVRQEWERRCHMHGRKQNR